MSATRMPLARLLAPWHAVEIWLALVSESLPLIGFFAVVVVVNFSLNLSLFLASFIGVVVIFLMDKLNNGSCHIIITLLYYTQSPSYEY